MFEESTIKYLYRNLKFHEYKPQEPVFDYGDKGTLFYIIMDGEVAVKTPAPEELEDE